MIAFGVFCGVLLMLLVAVAMMLPDGKSSGSIADEIVAGLTELADDLESGADLSKYRTTRLILPDPPDDDDDDVDEPTDEPSPIQEPIQEFNCGRGY